MTQIVVQMMKTRILNKMMKFKELIKKNYNRIIQIMFEQIFYLNF